MIRFLKPIAEDVARWSLVSVIISIVLSIISIILTVDLGQSSNLQLRIYIISMSNFLFYIGSVMITIGLLMAFFKRPSSSKTQSSIESKFTPKYRKRKTEISIKNQNTIKKSASPLLSTRETKLILSGGIDIGIAILIWIAYVVMNSLFLLES
ncbi:MAG: hypothetical protein ACFFAU_02875 [Candidatus Hodarchaeota archaeon]